MIRYIDNKKKQLNSIISRNNDDSVKKKKQNDLEQLQKCNQCEWGSDTGLSIYCPRLKCVK